MWNNDCYIYSTRVLKAIAQNYLTLYEGLQLSENTEINDPLSLVEFKADFDLALRYLGRGKWSGNIDGYRFNDFRWYGKLQKVIIADILEVGDDELMGLGFWDIPGLRGYSYYLMKTYLNGGERNGGKILSHLHE